MTGCGGSYGKIVKQADDIHKTSIDTLIKNREEYHVYSGTRDGPSATALMFDPKENSTRLTGKTWQKIESRDVLLKALDQINTLYPQAEVASILGSDRTLFGYLYYPLHLYIPVKQIDENTLYMMGFPTPISTP